MIPWILLNILIGLIVVGLLAVFMVRSKKARDIDYKTYYTMGLTWLPLGIVFMIVFDGMPIGMVFMIMGAVYMAIGLKNKDKWGKPVKMTKKQQKMRGWLIAVGVIILLLAFVAFIAVEEGFFSDKEEITSFDECIAAGFPAMESYPRQCSNGENTFTEELS
ncbi:MAG: hypothetical protein ABIG20_03360 [archaeon]